MLKKKDRILIGAILLIAGGMALWMQVRQGDAGETIRIMIDGEEYGTYSLMEDTLIEVENAFGYNRIVLKGGEVSMEEADCPDQYCVAHRAITKTNETIVCLPHKLVVEVLAVTEQEIDGIAQ